MNNSKAFFRTDVDYSVIENNTKAVKNLIDKDCEIMAVVKANAYGHGIVKSSIAAIKGGASWLGVAKVYEALSLRKELKKENLNPRIFTWIYGPNAPFEEMILADLDLSITTPWEIIELNKAIDSLINKGLEKEIVLPIRVQIKVDTGFSRNGFTGLDSSFEEAISYLKTVKNRIEVVGVWSHLAWADEPENKVSVDYTDSQIDRFEEWIRRIEKEGFDLLYKHILASSGILNPRKQIGNIVRPGILLYGITPNSETISQNDLEKLGFEPALTLKAQINNVKLIPKGSGVSYSQTYHVQEDTWVGIVPFGYADGLIREHNQEELVYVDSDKKLVKIAGRICMDQFVIDLGSKTNAKAGDWITLFGKPPAKTVNDWAKSAKTISYEVLSKL